MARCGTCEALRSAARTQPAACSDVAVAHCQVASFACMGWMLIWCCRPCSCTATSRAQSITVHAARSGCTQASGARTRQTQALKSPQACTRTHLLMMDQQVRWHPRTHTRGHMRAPTHMHAQPMRSFPLSLLPEFARNRTRWEESLRSSPCLAAGLLLAVSRNGLASAHYARASLMISPSAGQGQAECTLSMARSYHGENARSRPIT